MTMQGFRFADNRRLRTICCALLFAVGACTAPEATIQLGGSLSVLTSGTSFTSDALPDDWFASGIIPDNHVAVSASLTSSTLSITSTTNSFLVARRVRANVLATPYMSWRWRFEPGKWQYHPVRIIVGFSGGGADPVEQGAFARLFPGSAIPVYDRVMSFLWAPSALMRGTLVRIETETNVQREAHYTVRGGAENVGVWWQETVDLATLYRTSWPDDRIDKSSIAFIGVSSTTALKPLTVFISDLRLSR